MLDPESTTGNSWDKTKTSYGKHKGVEFLLIKAYLLNATGQSNFMGHVQGPQFNPCLAGEKKEKGRRDKFCK